MNNITVIKQGNKRKPEAFSQDKFKASIIASCVSVRVPDGAAEDTASRTLHELEKWLINKSEVTSSDIRREASKILETLSPEAGYLYKQNKNII